MVGILMFLAAISFVETVGYFHHRWVEHGAVLKYIRENKTILKIIELHWTHHVKNYPPENLRPENPYVTDDSLSWYIPGAIFTIIACVAMPWSWAIPFVGGGWMYGLFIDRLHERFHLKHHAFAGNRWFLYLQKIHDIHHIDQNKNFTIVCPLLDVLFNTYESNLPVKITAA